MIAPAPAAFRNPFPGLRPFRESEQNLFFGRESQVDRMVDKLAAERLLAVVGSSGTGKSSLVNCGFKPALRRGLLASAGTSWRMAQFRPGANPTRALASALAKDACLFPHMASGLRAEEMIEATLRLSGVGLVDLYKQARLRSDVNLLVIVDQFEELFRYRNLSTSDAYGYGPEEIRFVGLLLEAATQCDVPIYIVLTMRSDFLGECAVFDGLPEAVSEGQYLVPRMTRDERRSAVEGPIGVAECTISTALLTRLVNDVGDNPDQLSILQHALNRTWAHWRNQGKGEGAISLGDYDAVGTMAEALDRHAEKAFGELGTDQNKQVCERVFKALTDRGTDPRGIRRPTKLAILCDIVGATSDQVLEAMKPFRKSSRSFLFPEESGPVGPESVIDISHESLMRIWSRLRRWADEEAEAAREYRRLADRAEGFHAKRFGLMQDPDLQTALDFQTRQQPTVAWANVYGGGFDRAIQFLRMSKERRDSDAAEHEVERRWLAYWQPLIFGAVALSFLIVLFKYRASLLPSAADLSDHAKYDTRGKIWDLIVHFSMVSGIALGFALVYNIFGRLGQKIHRRFALTSTLQAIQHPRVTASTAEEQMRDPAKIAGTTYAPWWRRFLACAIDYLIIQIISAAAFAVQIGIFAALHISRASEKVEFLCNLVIVFSCVCAYQAVLVGSRLQATLGMSALRIYITDLQGSRLSRVRVVKRQVIKLLVYGTTCFFLLPLEALIRSMTYLLAKRQFSRICFSPTQAVVGGLGLQDRCVGENAGSAIE